MGFRYLGQPNILGNTLGLSGRGGLSAWDQFINTLKLGSELLLLDAGGGLYSDAGSTPIAADGSVQQWIDQTASAHVLAQTTAAAKPTYRASIAAFNNLPALEFDGGDYLFKSVTGLVADLTTFNAIVVYATTTNTAMAVYDEARAASGTPIIYAGSNFTTGHRGLIRDDSSTQGTIATTGNNANDGTAKLLTWRQISKSSRTLRRNGTQLGTNADTIGTITADEIAVGCHRPSSASDFLTGYVAGVYLYSADVYATVEPLIAARYGITLA